MVAYRPASVAGVASWIGATAAAAGTGAGTPEALAVPEIGTTTDVATSMVSKVRRRRDFMAQKLGSGRRRRHAAGVLTSYVALRYYGYDGARSRDGQIGQRLTGGGREPETWSRRGYRRKL
ncbi:hypothetical protein GCM10027569_78490 [Flindersiella endophytica]